jgi:hypothetical protein
MKKDNLIELSTYQRRIHGELQDSHNSPSNELETAIEMLIVRLREFGPLQKAK